MINKAVEVEDLAIQSTLSMTVEERLKLLANLIVEKIAEDQQHGEPLYRRIIGGCNGQPGTG